MNHRLRSSLLKSSRAIEPLLWLMLGIAYSIVALQDPLFTENQNTKFLHAAAKSGYALLSADWMANTIDPLPAFTLLIELLFRLHSIELVYLLFPLLLAAYLYAVTGIADRLFGIRKEITAMILFIAIFFLEERNIQLGFGTQYLIGHYFQPCVFGVFIILAVERHLNGATLWASALLAIASAFHPAYMPTALLVQGSFTALTISQEKKVSGSSIVPLLLFVLLSAPLLIRYKMLFSYTTPETGVQAMTILSTERIATHTKVQQWLNYEDYIGMAIILVGMFLARKSQLFWIMLPLALLIAVTVPFLYFYPWPPLEVLTPWRSSVILLPLAWSIIAGRFSAALLPLMGRLSLARHTLFAGGIIAIMLTTGVRVPKQIDRFVDRNRTEEDALMSFARVHSRQGDIWVVPTRKNAFERFRLESGVPILVNWKTHPYKDLEILEWRRRNRAVESFYSKAATPDGPKLLAKLAKDYGINHAIIGKAAPPSLYSGMDICWRDSEYTVVGIPGTHEASGKNAIHRHDRQRRLAQ